MNRFTVMNDSFRFLTTFLMLFLIFYGFNIAFIGISTPGGIYLPWLDEHCNYIKRWRDFYISASAKSLALLGYTVYTSENTLKVQEASGFRLVYSCLGYGIISCFSAFVLSIPRTPVSRLLFLFAGILIILILNLCRLIIISLYYNPQATLYVLDHHDIFNIMLYSILLFMMYRWART